MSAVHSVLVVVTRQIGDVLLTTPLIHAARLRWPQAAIDVLGFEGTLGMLQGNPDVSNLIATPARPGAGGLWRLARRLWRQYDLALIALEMGGSADLLAYLQPGEPVILMGPTGTPTDIPHGETVVLAGGGPEL